MVEGQFPPLPLPLPPPPPLPPPDFPIVFSPLSWEILRGGIPGNAGCCQRDADRHHQEPCRVPLSGSLTRAASGPPRTLSLQPPSPIFGAQPPHSPTLWGRFGPLSYLSFPPGAGGRTEPQRPPQDVPRGWGVGLPRSAGRHHAPAAPGFVSQATPSHPHHSGQAPQDMPRGPARWCPGPRPSRPPAPPAAPCTGPHRATPSRRPPEAGPVSPQGKPTQPTGFPGKARQNRSANLARLHNERGVRGEIMPAFGGALSRFFFSRRPGGES